MSKSTHYDKLKKYLPKGYLIEINVNTGASISLISKVLREERIDSKGILVEAYRIANAEKNRQEEKAKELASLEQAFKYPEP
jgi:hypothetical protein